MDIGRGDDGTPGRHRRQDCEGEGPATHTVSSDGVGTGGMGGRSSERRARRAATTSRPSEEQAGGRADTQRDHTSARRRAESPMKRPLISLLLGLFRHSC